MARGKSGGHPGKKKPRTLTVIDEPEEGTRSVLVMTDELAESGEPLMKGDGPLSFTCGACGRVLLDGVAPGQVKEVVVRCSCGAYNDTIHGH
jgi:hypothetical protein